MKIKYISLLWFVACFACNGFAQNWQSVGGGTSFTVRGIYSDTSNNRILISGNFEFAGGNRVNQVAQWDGNSWLPIGNGSGDTSCAYGCEPILGISSINDTIYVAGHQKMMGGDLNIPYLSRFNGNDWEPFGNPDNIAIIEKIDESLFCFVINDSLSGNSIESIGHWNGVEWQSFGDDLPAAISTVWVWTGEVFNGEYYFAGNFDMDIDNIHEIIKWDGNNWSGLANGGIIGDSWINDIIVYKDLLWVGGYFYEADGNAADLLMAYDGQQWIDPFPGILFTDQIKDLEVIDDELYITGRHLAYADTGQYGLARYDGQILRSFGGSLNYPEKIAGLNGELYAVTNKVFDGDTVNYIVQWMGGDSVDYEYYAALNLQETETFQFEMYPNPANDVVEIKTGTPLQQNTTLRLYDLQGRLIQEEQLQAGQHHFYVDVSQLQRGLYLLGLNGVARKIIIE